MRFFYFVYFSLFFSFIAKSEFRFEGEVNSKFSNASAYLLQVDDLNKIDKFDIEHILEECIVDSSGIFVFSGNYLENENRIYKIYIDNCQDNISDSKHLLKHCDNSVSHIFIANNTDIIKFPLNNLNQMFCSIESSSKHKDFIQNVEALRNQLLLSTFKLKSKKQRDILYKKYYNTLKEFGKEQKEPLVELYIAYLHLDKSSFTRYLVIDDVQQNSYYQKIIEQLKNKYPKSKYAENLALEIAQLPIKKDSESKLWIYLLVGLIVSVLLNILQFFLKNINPKNTFSINYKEHLTQQEQNVFKLMYDGLTNKEIAGKLFISVSTVKTHINNIYSKLKIKSRKEISPFFKHKNES